MDWRKLDNGAKARVTLEVEVWQSYANGVQIELAGHGSFEFLYLSEEASDNAKWEPIEGGA